MDARIEILERELAWARCTVHRLATCGVNQLAVAIQRITPATGAGEFVAQHVAAADVHRHLRGP